MSSLCARLAPFALVLLAACAPLRMSGFDALSARTDLEAVAMTGIPGWSSGSFRVGDDGGTVRRIAQADAIGWGPVNDGGTAFGNVQVGEAARFGTMEFALARPEPAGMLQGRCSYVRSETRGHVFGVDLAATDQPLQLRCAYRIGGRDAGSLDLVAEPTDANTMAEARVGTVQLNGRALRIASRHRADGVAFDVAAPAGYVLERAGGEIVAAVETNGAAERRLLLPRSGADRDAALAALVTLALFWDPGDVG
jgi:hypothetical protein